MSIKGSRWNIGTTLPWVSSDAWIDILNLRLVELKSAHKALMLLTNIGDCTLHSDRAARIVAALQPGCEEMERE